MTPTPMLSDRLIGQVIQERYRIQRLVAHGGMGSVYEALHEDLGKRVAVKILHNENISRELEARFRREARAASRLESEHIVSVFDAGRDPRFGLFIAMEYLEGEDLEVRLVREVRLPVESAIRIAYHVGLALSIAHKSSIVHRDLKPANIFLCDKRGGECAKLLDFGISKSVMVAGMNASDNDLTIAGTVMGTIQYISPEQAVGMQATPASDLWALGVVMFEMLSGACAYDSSDSAQDTLFQIASGPPPQLSKIAHDVPWAIAEIVEVLMKREPNERFKDADEFLAALDFAATRLNLRDSMVGSNAHIPLSHTASELRAVSSLALSSTNSKMLVPSPEEVPVREASKSHKRRLPRGDEDTVSADAVDTPPQKLTPKSARTASESPAPETVRVTARPSIIWSPIAVGMLILGLVLVAIALVLLLRGV